MDAKVAAAFIKAQTKFAPAIKGSKNDHFKNKYADLAACVDAVIDALNENGLALIQTTHECDSGVCVETILVHESGGAMSGGKLRVPAPKQDPQGYGSALTYARRYSLMATCGIAPEDDDGNAASRPGAPRQASIEDAVKQVCSDAKVDPAKAAAKLATVDDARRDAIWAKLPESVQELLASNWPG